MTVLTAITGGNVGAAATGEAVAFSSHANGDLEIIASADDADFGEVTTNADGNYADGYLLDNMPGDFVTMTDLSVQLRYGWSATPSDSAWVTLDARIVVESDGTILAAGTAGGAYENIASSITDTSPTNSSVTSFTYVNTSANKAAWDDANLQIRMVRDRSKGGGTEGQRTYAGEITGNYSAGGSTDLISINATITGTASLDGFAAIYLQSASVTLTGTAAVSKVTEFLRGVTASIVGSATASKFSEFFRGITVTATGAATVATAMVVVLSSSASIVATASVSILKVLGNVTSKLGIRVKGLFRLGQLGRRH